MRRPGKILALALSALCAATGFALGQISLPGSSFLNPFPPGDVHKVLSIGDDLAEGLLYGISEAFTGDTRVDIIKRTQKISGLTRNDFDSRLGNLNDVLASDPPSVAVIMVGAYDRDSLRRDGKRAAVGSSEWRAEYGARADLILKSLKKYNVAAYWVGLPNVRKPQMDEDVKMMNDIIRERVYVNGMKYVDAYAAFVDEQGGFSAYGPDQTGKMRLLRGGDGVYLTSAGNRKLAFYVERELKRDLTQAKADRNIPLAGSAVEQKRIRPQSAAVSANAQQGPPAAGGAGALAQPSADASTKGQTGLAGPGDWAAVTTQSQAPARPAPPPPAADQAADNGKISLRLVSQSGREETITLDILRPSIPASVVALVTRRASPDKLSQMGEQLVDKIAGGLTVMSSVTPSSTVTSSGDTRRLSPTQSPYYRVMMKGERLTPRKGRADDFTWPRSDAMPPRTAAAPAPPGGGEVAAGKTTPPSQAN